MNHQFKWIIVLIGLLVLVSTASATVTQYNLTSGNDTIIIFNGTGSIDWTPPANVTLWYTVVAGGGGGGGVYIIGSASGAGGGAGGFLNSTFNTLNSTNYTIVVGSGGTGGFNANGTRGTNSTISNASFSVIAWGGGGGAGYPNGTFGGGDRGQPGGSGGGNSYNDSPNGGPNVSGQGFYGGTATTASQYGSGGGGGAGANGSAGTTAVGGNGGKGLNSSITGVELTYAGGGGGSINGFGSAVGTGGLGGGGGGSRSGGTATAGTNALGGGGGGGAQATNGGAGGSGVVIVRYTDTTSPPTANFSMSNTTGINSVKVNFTDLSTYNPTSWNWSFGGANFSDGRHPNYTFVGAGNYTVILNVSNSNGWSNKTQYVTVFSYENNTTLFINSSINLTYYTVRLLLNNTTGISNTAGVFYTNGTTRTDWADVVFTDNSDSRLDFWIENHTQSTTDTSFWVEVPNIWSLNNTTIKMYYGCSTQSVIYSNGTNTFPLFDDFDNATVQTALWDVTGSVTESGSIATIPSSGAIQSKKTFGTNTAYRSRINIGAGTAYSANGYQNGSGGSNYYGILFYTHYTTANVWNIMNRNPDPTNTVVSLGTTYTGNRTYDIYRNGSGSTLFKINDTYVGNISTNVPTSNISINLYGQAQAIYPDWVLVRNFTLNEPIVISANGTAPASPVANFTMSNITGWNSLKVNFTDTSSNGPTSWNWTFGGANFSDSQNPNYTFVGGGNYTVILNVSNSLGWSNKTSYIFVGSPLNYGNVTTFFINSSVNLTRYQVKLILNNTTGVEHIYTFGKFYTNGTTRPDWSDVVFTDSSDNLLGFWKENNTEVSNNATFWINIPNIWTLNNITIKMYYGCSTQPLSFANGYNTFLFFDDFIDTELSLNWTNSTGGLATISNGTINITANSATARQIYSNYSRFSWTQPYAVRGRVMSAHFADTSHQELFQFTNSSNAYGQWVYYTVLTGSITGKYNNYNGGYNTVAIPWWTVGSYHTQDIIRNGTTSSIFKVDNANTTEFSTGYQYTMSSVGIYADTSGSIMNADWIFVRNSTQFEPSIINANGSNAFINDTWFASGSCYYMINQSTNDTIVKCNTTGTYNWTIPSNTNSIWYLVIAGGGAGGGQNSAGNSGGGGAGGLLNGTLVAPSSGIVYNITVGTGGINSTAATTRGGNGTNSSFGNLTYNLTAVGGGGGGMYVSPANVVNNGSNGGSGGGGGQGNGFASIGGSNVSGQGWAGNSSSTGYYSGAGGGGSGEVGWRGTGGANLVSGGKGGNGTAISITGCLTYYAGGGSGASWTSTGTNDGGGLGGGGRGKYGSNISISGLNDYGGGGGGGGENTYYGANGGSGVVILRYNTSSVPPTANFTMSNTTGWNSVKVNFTDTSSGAPTSWNWTFGGANFSDGQHPNYTFVGAGNYTVILNVSNSNGWSNVTKYVLVNGPGDYGNVTTFFVNSSVNLTNYQVQIILNNTTGISNITGIFYTNGTTRTDWRDIVFTDTSDNILGFWRENNTNVATNATFWVKVPSIWSLNNTTIRMYYGCSTQTIDYIDGYNTFLLFDDFLGSSLNTTQWNNIGTVSVANGYVQHTTTASATVQGIFSYNQYGIGTAARLRVNDSAANFPEWGYDGGANMIGFTDDGTFKLYTYINPNQANVYVTTSTTSFQVSDIMRPNTSLGKGCINGICNVTTNYVSSANINVSLRNYANSGSRVMFSDWFVVRTYNASEPIVINSNGTAAITPVANFTMSNKTGSHPLKVNFTDDSVYATSWNWSFGDGTYSDSQYPNKTFTTFGNYTIILNASNILGWDNTTNYVLVSNLSNYTIITYTSNATLTIPANVTFIEYVVVAGGGSGGGYFGGGGGAGGLLQGNGYSVLSNTNYSIIIGAGGAAGAAGGTNGTNSSFGNGTNITAIGGGEGAVGGAQSGSGRASSVGGSGGGGGSTTAVVTGSAGISGQGNAGGNSGGQSGQYASGGGGGSSEAGATAANGGPGGKGGNGTQVNITGTLTWYAGGGGGASGSGSTAGAGGNGGGGSGATQSLATGNIVADGTNATANTGGGGGGGGLTGSNDYQRMGGSGIVIIRYLLDIPAPTANFSMSNTTAWNSSLKVNFTDTSINTPTSWNWTFGGANFSDGQNPNYTFVGAGNYTVRLNASNSAGWSNITKYVFVDGPVNYGNVTTFFVNGTNNQTNYQVMIQLNNTTGVGTTSGFFYTNGTTKANWFDVVFTNATDDTLLGYWRENGTDVATNTTFWMKVNVSSLNTTKVRMYYGYPSSVTSFENGTNTFVLFDDFSTSNINDTRNWIVAASPDAITMNNTGIVYLAYPSSVYSNYTTRTYNQSYTLESRARSYSNAYREWIMFSDKTFSNNAGFDWGLVAANLYSRGGDYTSIGTAYTGMNVYTTKWNANNTKNYVNRSLVDTRTATGTGTGYNVSMILGFGSAGGKLDFDWIFVREYADNDPIIINTNYSSIFQNDTWYASGFCYYMINQSTNDTIVKCNTTGTYNWTIPSNITNLKFLVVAGGGGGGGSVATGDGASGGGAGGYIENTSGFSIVTGGIYNITVGNGGSGGVARTTHANNGTNSSFGNLTLNFTAVGGGHGDWYGQVAGNGGSGGGGPAAGTRGSGITGQGYAGGYGIGSAGGGGGGASHIGYNATDHTTTATGGAGGNGTISLISGVSVCYAGGGSSGSYKEAGIAATCGGGASGASSGGADGLPGTNETGGGGGGATLGATGNYNGGMGGTGIVYLRYNTTSLLSPIANFTMSNSTGASPLLVNFTDVSTGSPTSWNWTFGGANFSDAQYPNYTFVGRGNYSVTLNVSNSAGFSNITKYVNVTTYTVVRFNITGNNTWICPDNVTSIDYIIVAGGGGGGGNSGGGGGAGGMKNGTSLSVKNGSVYTIIVGAGGTAGYGAYGVGAKGDNGNNTSISNATFNINVTGGGAGGAGTDAIPNNGGSGGGRGTSASYGAGGSGIAGQGNNGGAGETSNPFSTGGGGGAGAVGGTGTSRTSGNGGSGLGSNITVDNSVIIYAGGGGGGSGGGDNPKYRGTGGSGGGGNGGNAFDGSPVTAGTDGLGGGGGGAATSSSAEKGGSGTVVIRYESITDITPIANFTASNWTGQAPLLVTFTDTSTNAPTSWNWTFNATSNTNFSDAYQPSFTYTVAGNYTVILNVSNSAGFDNVTKYIEVLPTPPVASFTLSNTTGYDSVLVQFNDTSSNNPTAWIWNATNVTGNNTPFTFSLVQNASYTFGIGNFSISLNASNAGGSNVSTQNSWVNVSVGSVIVNFTSNVTNSSLYAMVVRFNDTSSGNPTTWNWSFGDGRWFNTTDPNLANTTYQYAVAGKYNVTLVANSTIGSNSTTKVDYINLTSDDNDNATGPNLVSWLHMNGTDGSTVFDDEKGFAWLSVGNASITTSTYKFGGSSGSFDGISSYISTPHNNEFNFSTGNDFTIEMWTNVTFVNAGDQLIDKGNASQTEGWGIDNSNGTEYGWDFWMGNDVTGQTPYFRIPMNEWTHVAITRESGTVKVYINGMLNATKVGMTGDYDTVNPLRVGFLPPTNYYNGYIDELRISNNISRWTSNFTTPYAEYSGDLEITYPDINPDSTFRYKTNPGGIAYIDNQTQRNRTLQIQNVTHADYVAGSIIFNPLYDYVKSVQLNTSYYPAGMTLVSSSIDNNIGIINFNISRAAGFTPGTDRASILDYTVIYTNYTDGSDNVSEYFGSGYLVNSSVDRHYSINNFLPTQVTYGDWNFTANFTANNLTSPAFTPIQFVSTFNGSYPNRWNWSFGDGEVNNGINSTILHSYNSGGYKNITLTEYLWQNGSVSNVTTKINYIYVYHPTTANISSNVTSALANIPIEFNASNSTNATWWNWSFGDGEVNNYTNETVIHSYISPGIYYVNLTTSYNGYGEDTQSNYEIQVLNSTITGFVANTTVGIFSLNVGFNVTDANDDATQWNWSFGDGTWQNGTTQNATHIYSTGGIYTVSEIASNPFSMNVTTITDYITVYNQTIANITSNVTSGLTPTAVQFYANTSTNATWWNWSFGDGNVSNITIENPVYTYSSGGNYTVTLTTSNDGWGEDIITPYYIQVYDAPITGFDANVTYGLLPLHVGFNVTTVDDHATSWNWSFGDGVFGNTQNVTHIYTTGGNYTVYEIATNPYYSNVTSKSFYISVFSPTSNTFTPNISSGYIPLNVLFTAVTVNATWFNWSWGDGTWSNVTNGTTTALHIFTLPQNHTVNLTTSNNGFGGCTTTQYINATFYGAAASFTAVPSSGTPPLSVVFTDTSTNIPINWNWSFGDGTYSTSQNVNHTYSSVGVYTVILNASNTFGWSNYSRNITVYSGAPVANFTVNNSLGASPLAVRFSNDSTYTNASSVTWYWQFGDGGISYDSNPVHSYTMNGVYHANLTITDEVGNDLSSDTLIYVTGSLIPIPDFIGVPASGSSPLNVTFTDLTLGGKTGWNWSFGDGNYSNLQNPTHNYTSNGQYTVTLVVANGTLSNYTTKVGYINVGVGTNIVNADYYGTPVTGNYPLTVQFYDTSVCNPICNSWNWDLDGDGATDSNAKNPSFTYNYPLTYSPKLIASNGVNSGTRIHVGYIIVGPTYMPTTIPQPTASWVPGYQDNQTGLSVSFRGDASTDLNNGTYLKYWLQNFTTTGNFNVYGFVTSVMAPLMHVFGFWIFLIIWGLYIFAVWIRAQDVTLPLIIGIISMGTFGLLFPKEALPVIIIMFVICGAIIITKLMKDSI